MAQDKNSNKIKLFLFLIFAILMVAFFAYTVRIFKDLFTKINDKNTELKCNNINYILTEQDYRNNRIILEIMSQSYERNITKITVIPDTSDSEYILDINPNLEGGDSVNLIIENISISKGLYSFVETCKERKKYYSLP
jgi:hypothetical protein